MATPLIGDTVERRWRKAIYYMSPTATPFAVQAQAEKMVRKFATVQESLGWQPYGKPVVAKMTVADERNIGGKVWHPYMMKKHFLISREHPLVKPDRDLYIIWLPCKRRPKVITLDVPDEIVPGLIEKGLVTEQELH